MTSQTGLNAESSSADSGSVSLSMNTGMTMVPTFLFVGLADRPSDRLDDVHLEDRGGR